MLGCDAGAVVSHSDKCTRHRRRAIEHTRDGDLHAATLTVASGNDEARRMYYEEGFRSLSEQMILPLDSDFVRFGPEAKED